MTTENVSNLSNEEKMLLNDPSISYWLKNQIKRINERDVLDALNDTQILIDLLNSRFRSTTSTNSIEFEGT